MIQVFWDMVSCSFICNCWHFGGAFCLYLQDYIETLKHMNKTVCYIQEGNGRHMENQASGSSGTALCPRL